MINDLWYKNAVIYCLSVGTYMDSNGDGIGDFKGLMRRLDYLHGLGVTAIWLMPFQVSPHRDDGYDVSDYYGVDPRYGTIGDFVEFTHGAKQRGIRVLIDLVVNHTSDEHGWFKQARKDNLGLHLRMRGVEVGLEVIETMEIPGLSLLVVAPSRLLHARKDHPVIRARWLLLRPNVPIAVFRGVLVGRGDAPNGTGVGGAWINVPETPAPATSPRLALEHTKHVASQRSAAAADRPNTKLGRPYAGDGSSGHNGFWAWSR
jgi:hypothetical protein